MPGTNDYYRTEQVFQKTQNQRPGLRLSESKTGSDGVEEEVEHYEFNFVPMIATFIIPFNFLVLGWNWTGSMDRFYLSDHHHLPR